MSPALEALAIPRLDFERTYREHFDFVLRMARRLGGAGFDAEDAAQEVFLVVARRLDGFDESAQITAWLFGITRNVVRHQRRKRWRGRLQADAPADAPADTPLDPVELREARAIAREILERLAPKKRDAFVLAELGDWTCEEIARAVGSRTETIWSRLFYARREFAARLAARLAVPPTPASCSRVP